MTADFGPRGPREELVFAGENFRIEVQHMAYRLMREQGVSQEDLARLLDVDVSKIKRFFSDDCKVPIRMIGRIFHALGQEVDISCRPTR